MSRAHARLGPSSAARWIRCPGSVNLIHGHKIVDSSSWEADEGTFAHEIAENCLCLGFDASHFIGCGWEVNGNLFECDTEMAAHLQPGLDRIWELVGDGKLYTEMTVDTSRWCGKGNFGTLDRGIIRSDLIVIGDLKYGAGVPVYIEDNEQVQIYALAFWDQVARHLTDTREFLLIIDQPRIPGAGGELRMTLDDLLAFGEMVKERAALTEQKDAPIVPGEKQCRWCPAKDVPGRCPAHENWMLDIGGIEDLGELDELVECGAAPDLPNEMTPERRSYIVSHAKLFTEWLDRLHASALADALAGLPTPGLKAVMGRRPARKWRDDKAVESVLAKAGLRHDQIFNYSMKSPTQVEKDKLPVWAELNTDAFIEQGEGKPALVPESDKREAIRPAIHELEDEDEKENRYE